MLKKMIILSSLASALAFSDNFYLGGGIGFSSFDSKERTLVPNEQHNLGGFGFTGMGMFGYNITSSINFDLGLEFFANGNTAQNKVNHNFNDTELTIFSRYNLGLRALPGYQFSDVVEGHLIVGYTYGTFRIKDDGVYGTISKKFGANGYQLGMGTTISIPWNFALRLDAIYSGYSSEKHIGTANGGGLNQYTIHPRSFDGTASLIYNF